LRNVIELVSLLRAGSQVRIRDLPPALQEGIVSNGGRRVSPAWVSKDIIQVGLDRPLEDIIDQVLHAVLELEGGNRSHAAHRLGISLRTVQRHLARQ